MQGWPVDDSPEAAEGDWSPLHFDHWAGVIEDQEPSRPGGRHHRPPGCPRPPGVGGTGGCP